MTSVLVTGASVAGPAVASLLARQGFDVTVIERADALREGGQNIDVRGTGREVLRRMGLEDAVRARNTGEVGTRFVDEAGSTISEIPVEPGEADGPTAELEILRGALAQVLVDDCPDSVSWRFGTHVTGIDQDADGAVVTFDADSDERFDVVLVAEGVGSATRQLVMGDVEEVELGMYSAYGTIPRTSSDDDWWRVLVAPGSRQAALRPDDEGTIRANLNFLADGPELAGLDAAQQRTRLRERFDGVAWEVPRILDGFDACDDLYVDWLRQVKVSRWHDGRVCLLGDAAWCVTPIGGGGASLALVGAYVLAAFLSASDRSADGIGRAFEQYDAWMRPLVDEAQDLPPGVPRVAAPRTRVGVEVFRLGVRVAGLPLVRRAAQKITGGPQSERELPPLPSPCT